jgi:CRISPR-associated endonuclease/helicase Cas3
MGEKCTNGEFTGGHRFIAHRKGGDSTGPLVDQPLLEHLVNVAQTTSEFASEFGAGEVGYTIGLSHDLGKYSAEFQRRIRGASNQVDHSTAGGQYLYKANNTTCLARLAAYCVMGHHGGLPDGGRTQDTSDDRTLLGRLVRAIKDYSAFEKELAIPPLVPPEPETVQFSDGFSYAFFVRMLFSSLVDADWLDTEQFMDGEKPRGGFDSIELLNERLGKCLEQFAAPKTVLDTKRNELLDDCRAAASAKSGAFTLTAPTGSGKTLSSAAFALAHAVKNHKRRVIYVVPYNTIIEQNASVFEDILGAENVVQHHSGVEYSSGDEKLSGDVYR